MCELCELCELSKLGLNIIEKKFKIDFKSGLFNTLFCSHL